MELRLVEPLNSRHIYCITDTSRILVGIDKICFCYYSILLFSIKIQQNLMIIVLQHNPQGNSFVGVKMNRKKTSPLLQTTAEPIKQWILVHAGSIIPISRKCLAHNYVIIICMCWVQLYTVRYLYIQNDWSRNQSDSYLSNSLALKVLCYIHQTCLLQLCVPYWKSGDQTTSCQHFSERCSQSIVYSTDLLHIS